ncbi:MAG: pentapeptide repeat-containing protein [Alphaproteobacteria bacterium]|nr:pentapeptide repeat-containing protein [Alphaproteobacteria bacterium]
MHRRLIFPRLIQGFAVWILYAVLGAHPATAACNDPPGPGVDWRQCNFDRYDLEKIDLSGARLDNASFNRAALAGTNFTALEGGRVRFIGANLQDTVFERAQLRYADFSQANLSGASFKDADLANTRLVSANLRGANLTGSRLRGADLFRADLSGATWVDGQRVCAEGSISFCR